MYACTYSVPVCAIRCANLFGGGDLNLSRAIPAVIHATLTGERFVIRSDGKLVRDFLYVQDSVDAYLRVVESLAARPSLAGEAFNFGLDIKLTVLKLTRQIIELRGCTDLEPIVQNEANSESREQYLSSEKARRMLSWTPRYTLAEGLEETIDWYRNYFERSATR